MSFSNKIRPVSLQETVQTGLAYQSQFISNPNPAFVLIFFPQVRLLFQSTCYFHAQQVPFKCFREI